MSSLFLFQVIGAEIALAWWLIHYLVTHDRGPKEPPKMVAAAGGFGLLGLLLSLPLELTFIPSSIVDLHHKTPISLSLLLSGFLTVGIIEELTKALPLALFIYKKGYFNELTDGIIYFATAGMIFGMFEDIGYTLSFGSGVGLLRIITAPFIHAGFSALIGWGVVRFKLLKTSPLELLASVALAITAHSLYDAGLASGKGWATLGSLILAIFVNVSIFVLYHRAQKLDEARGMSAIQPNNFCPHCGTPNPRHFLFCTNCGQKT